VRQVRDLGPLLVVSLLAAWGIVLMWRVVLTICLIVCLAVMFAGVLAIIGGARHVLADGSAAGRMRPRLSYVAAVSRSVETCATAPSRWTSDAAAIRAGELIDRVPDSASKWWRSHAGNADVTRARATVVPDPCM